MNAQRVRLIHANDEHFDIMRERIDEQRFSYRFVNGEVIKAKDLLAQIDALVVPPNWEKVKITSNEMCHIRAYGYDLAERKQYIYHPLWLETQNLKKFNRMPAFGKVLPDIRERANQDLQRDVWDKPKVLALAVMTLDESYMRIGNAQYLSRNETYGLTTLRRKHLEISDGALVFDYKGKGGKYRKVRIDNKQLANLIRKSSELPGYEIFRYKANGRFHAIDSHDVNEYLREVSGADFTAKDFRTWGGSTLAVELYPEAKRIVKENPRKKLATNLVKLVAKQLGNTVSVCRDYYIHPGIMACVAEGRGEELAVKAKSSKVQEPFALSPEEQVALKLMEKHGTTY